MSISSVGATFSYPTTTSPLVRRQAGTGAPGSASENAVNPSPAVAHDPPTTFSTRAAGRSAEPASLLDTSKESSKESEAGGGISKDAEGAIPEEEQKEVSRLEKRDLEVRSHEQAHLAAAGQYAAGGASFDYETGPDGKRYAVGGDVSISVSEEQTPEATVAKMQVVVRAALAPAQPSAQDHRVAAEASQKAAAARRELTAEKTDTESPEARTESTDTGDASEISQVSAEAGSIIPSQAQGAGFEAIAERARTTGAQKAYDRTSPITRTMDWTA